MKVSWGLSFFLSFKSISLWWCMYVVKVVKRRWHFNWIYATNWKYTLFLFQQYIFYSIISAWEFQRIHSSNKITHRHTEHIENTFFCSFSLFLNVLFIKFSCFIEKLRISFNSNGTHTPCAYRSKINRLNYQWSEMLKWWTFHVYTREKAWIKFCHFSFVVFFFFSGSVFRTAHPAEREFYIQRNKNKVMTIENLWSRLNC